MQIVQHRRRTYAAKRRRHCFYFPYILQQEREKFQWRVKENGDWKSKEEKDNKKREWDSCKVLKKSKNSERLFPHGENMIYLYVITAFFAAKRKS